MPSLANITIASGGSFDLTAPLTTGTSIEFLNTPVASGVLRIEPTAYENQTIVASGSTVISTYLGGTVDNFQPGDTIVIANLGATYAEFDHAPSGVTAAQNAAVSSAMSELLTGEGYLGLNEILTISSTGSITDNTGLIEGNTLSFFGGLVTFSLPSTDIGYIDSYSSSIEQALFGGLSVTSSIYITIAADAGNSSIADGYITTDGTIVVCYLRGTKLLTPTGEKNIEDLAIGDPLVTRYSGIQPVKWIGEQHFDPRFAANNRDIVPVRIKAGALGENLPARDLYVSPGHSVLVGETLLLAKNLVNGITITQDAFDEDIHYYLIEFEKHDCVIAQGTWAESYADCPGLRNKFHNAASFAALYPDYATPAELYLCAPRPEHGPELDIALRPVVAHASAGVTPGRLRGYIERIEASGLVEGWAQDMENPDLPVLLDIMLDDQPLGTVLACGYRGDLEQAGLGSGRCLFSFTGPDLSPADQQSIRVCRAADGAGIPLSDACAAKAA